MAHSENGRGHEHHGDFRSNIGDKIEKNVAEVAALSNTLHKLRHLQ